MGPPENLALDGRDLRLYLDAFLDAPFFPEVIHPVSFPAIQEFVTIRPVRSFHSKVYVATIVELARSQPTRGVPFEPMDFCTRVPFLVADELVTFVDTINYYKETL